MLRLNATHQREIADRLLRWLKERGMDVWPRTSVMIHDSAQGLHEEVFQVWKGYDLLRAMGRIELNCANGRKGGQVVDFTPLSQGGDMHMMTDVVCTACQGSGVIRSVPYGEHRRDQVCPRCDGFGRRREPAGNQREMRGSNPGVGKRAGGTPTRLSPFK